jgi:hypothetical protein
MDFQIRLSNPEDSEKTLKRDISLRNLSLNYSSNQIDSLVRSQAAVRFKGDEIGLVAECENEVIGFAWISSQEPLNESV